MPSIRRAEPGDAPRLLPLVQALNDHEAIPWQATPLASALARLLGDSTLGLVLVADEVGGPERPPAGYAIATFGFDLEFAGRDAFLTELYVAPAARGQGLGRRLLAAVELELRAADIRALHLMVRPDNAEARALYDDVGFVEVPRRILTKRLDAPLAVTASDPAGAGDAGGARR